jgi:hypothetical protein
MKIKKQINISAVNTESMCWLQLYHYVKTQYNSKSISNTAYALVNNYLVC